MKNKKGGTMSISFRFVGSATLSSVEKQMVIYLVKNWKKTNTVHRTFAHSILYSAFQNENGKSIFAKLIRQKKLNKYKIAWIWYTKKNDKTKQKHWKYICFFEKKQFPGNFTMVKVFTENVHNPKAILDKINNNK